jgi:hypothetical protein
VNNISQFPLHLAASKPRSGNGFPPEIIKNLVEKFPIAARSTDKDGMLPLHYVACNANQYVIEVLLNAFPAAICHSSKKGKFAIAPCLLR